MGSRSRGVRAGGIGDGGREIDSETFGCPGAFNLASSDSGQRTKDNKVTWTSYIPLALEGFQIDKRPGDGIIAQVGLVLL